MSLIICPECKNPNTSDKAFFCPRCGYPILLHEYFNKNADGLKQDIIESEETPVIQKQIQSIENDDEEKVIYTVNELKDILGVGINQVYDLVKSGKFPVKHIGKKIVIPVKPFIKWLNNIADDN